MTISINILRLKLKGCLGMTKIKVPSQTEINPDNGKCSRNPIQPDQPASQQWRLWHEEFYVKLDKKLYLWLKLWLACTQPRVGVHAAWIFTKFIAIIIVKMNKSEINEYELLIFTWSESPLARSTSIVRARSWVTSCTNDISCFIFIQHMCNIINVTKQSFSLLL